MNFLLYEQHTESKSDAANYQPKRSETMDENLPVIVGEVKTDIERLAEWSKNIVVTNPTQRATVYEATKGVKTRKAQVLEFYKDMKTKARAAWQGIVDKEKSYTDILDTFEAAAKRAILKYDTEEEQKRIAEQRRLQAIADEKARVEREKAEAEARRQRAIEEEARQKAEAARRAAEQASAEERARLLKEAEAAERKAAAANAKAETKTELAAAVVAPVVEIAPTVEKQKGETTKTTWKARIINAALVPREYCVPNEKELDAIAKATKGSKQIPGVEFYPEQTLSMRK
jgi:hypothetical protein